MQVWWIPAGVVVGRTSGANARERAQRLEREHSVLGNVQILLRRVTAKGDREETEFGR